MLKRVLSAVLIMSVMFALPSWGASFRKMNDEQFWYLCHEGSEAEIIDAISKGANVHAAGALSDGLFIHEGVTPLMIVRTPGAISALVKAGADVNAADSRGETPIMWIRSTEVTKALIKAGADVNARNRSGQTPLMFAARFNTNPEVINALIDGGDEDLTDKDGKTALVHAKEMGTSEIIDALIKPEHTFLINITGIDIK